MNVSYGIGIKEDGLIETASVRSINFTGGVDVTNDNGAVTVDVVGGSGGGDKYATVSTTTNAISNPNTQLSFTVGTGLSYIPNQDILVVYNATNYMNAHIESYNSTTGALVAHVEKKTGSGTYSNWTINLGSVHVDPTVIVNDLTTGGTTSALSAEQGKALNTTINNLPVNYNMGISVSPTSTPTGTGAASWTAVAAGTYTNFGGVVLPANSIGVISRSATNVYTISYTPIDLSTYATQKKFTDTKYSDLVQTLDTVTSTNYYVNLSGALISAGGWKTTELINITNYNITDVSIIANNSVSGISFWDASGVFISGITGATNAVLAYSSLTYPTNCVSVRFSWQISPMQAHNANINYNIKKQITDSFVNSTQTTAINTKTNYSSLLQTLDTVTSTNYYVNLSGSLMSAGGWKTTELINIANYNITDVSIIANDIVSGISFWDEYGVFISGITGATNSVLTYSSLTYPTNCTSVRFSWQISPMQAHNANINYNFNKTVSNFVSLNDKNTAVTNTVFVNGNRLSSISKFKRKIPTIAFMFDDSFHEVDRWMIQAFIDRGIVPTMGLISVDGASIPLSEYAPLVKKGFGFMSHTKNHLDLTSLTDAQIKTECVDSLNRYKTLGLPMPRGLFYPGNLANAHTDSVISQYFEYSLWGQWKTTSILKTDSNYGMSRFGDIESKTLQQLKDAIDAAIIDKGFVAFWGHSWRISGGTYTLKQADFLLFLDYVKLKMDNYEIAQMTMDNAVDYFFM